MTTRDEVEWRGGYYEIRVSGHLASCWSEWFEGLRLENVGLDVAVISGEVRDQAALHGALANGKVLVAYATWAGSTAEVAEAIGGVLSELDASVDVRPIRDVRSVEGYGAVVVGAPVRNAKVKSEAITFVKKHRQALGAVRTAYFTACITMVEDTPANRATAAGYLAPLREVREPVGMGLFGGKVDHSALSFPWNVMLSFVKEGPMSDGDHRDWEAIRAWAREVAPSCSRRPSSRSEARVGRPPRMPDGRVEYEYLTDDARLEGDNARHCDRHPARDPRNHQPRARTRRG